MQNTVYLIRHGEVDNPEQILYGRTPIHLSEKGKEQIHSLAVKLRQRDISPQVIFSSPQQRTRETTDILLTIFPATPVLFEDRLQEVDTGDLTGKPLSFINQNGDLYTSSAYIGMHIETRESVTTRIFTFLEEMVKQYDEKTIFVVSHGDPIAFVGWTLRHPGVPMPKASDMEATHDSYPQKGEAWKLVIDTQMQATGFERISG